MNRHGIVILSTASLAAVALILGVAFLFQKPTTHPWIRPPASGIVYYTQKGDDLHKVAAEHGNVPALMLAAFNDRSLRVGFDQTCLDDLTWPRPGHYFCNRRLNLARASTLAPNQVLRIPDSTAIPADIRQTIPLFGRAERLAILVDGSSALAKQRGLDAAVEWNLALNADYRQLATIWVYDWQGMVEYHNEANVWNFGTNYTPLEKALRALDTGQANRIILVTDAPPKDVEIARLQMQTPITGYCLTSACQPQMEHLTKMLPDGWTVPFTH